MTLTPKADDGGNGWRGISTAPFYLDVKAGDSLSLLYDWKGDTEIFVVLQQLQLSKDNTKSRKADGVPTVNLMQVGDTEEDWNTSWSYVLNPVVEDTTDDGKYCLYVMVQPNGNVDIKSYVDNIRIIKVGADEETIYDLNGNIIKFGTDTPDILQMSRIHLTHRMIMAMMIIQDINKTTIAVTIRVVEQQTTID